MPPPTTSPEAARHDWARRHPTRAAEERDLRLARRQARDDFGHKVHGTVETHAKAARVRQGSIARLYASGAIDVHQLGAAAEIAAVGRTIGAELGMRTVSLETRVDGGGRAGGAFWEALGRVRAEWAYTRWRASLARPGPVLALVIDDAALGKVARTFAMRSATARGLLIAALDAWPDFARDARDAIDEADVLAAHAGLI